VFVLHDINRCRVIRTYGCSSHRSASLFKLQQTEPGGTVLPFYGNPCLPSLLIDAPHRVRGTSVMVWPCIYPTAGRLDCCNGGRGCREFVLDKIKPLAQGSL